MLCVAVVRTPAGAEESLPDMPPAPHTPCMRLPDVGEVAQQGGLGLCQPTRNHETARQAGSAAGRRWFWWESAGSLSHTHGSSPGLTALGRMRTHFSLVHTQGHRGA